MWVLVDGQAGPCMVHGAWNRCVVVHAASCMGGVPAGGWVKACVYYQVGKSACTYYLDLVKLELGLGLDLV